jgi:hypothetical protein
VILRGQRAWTRIKSTAAEQRQLWREVGEALLEGRRQWPSNQAFGAWCANEGFDMAPATRSNAMWLATNWSVLNGVQHDLTHPTHIRQEYRDLQASQAPSPSLDLSAPADPALERIAKVAPVARKVNALAAHAAGTGPEAETARKYLKKQAAIRNMSVEEMVDTADKLDAVEWMCWAG